MPLCCHGYWLFSIFFLVVTTASFRGVSAVDASVVWASGTEGTVVRTIDGGKTWSNSKVGSGLDFRGIHALDARVAWILSSGPGDKSRIYKTDDGGEKWTLQFTNADAQGFFDAISFFDAEHGIVLGDPVDSRFVILTTSDGGKRWTRQTGPAALPNEGAFAASNTCLIVQGRSTAWFATGGARVFRSEDGCEAGPLPQRRSVTIQPAQESSPSPSPMIGTVSPSAEIIQNQPRVPPTSRLLQTADEPGRRRAERAPTDIDPR